MNLSAESRLARVEMQQVFAADPNLYMGAIEGYDIFDLASSLFLFTVCGLDAKSLFWRGIDGMGSRISFSPPEGIRLNHDR